MQAVRGVSTKLSSLHAATRQLQSADKQLSATAESAAGHLWWSVALGNQQVPWLTVHSLLQFPYNSASAVDYSSNSSIASLIPFGQAGNIRTYANDTVAVAADELSQPANAAQQRQQQRSGAQVLDLLDDSKADLPAIQQYASVEQQQQATDAAPAAPTVIAHPSITAIPTLTFGVPPHGQRRMISALAASLHSSSNGSSSDSSSTVSSSNQGSAGASDSFMQLLGHICTSTHRLPPWQATPNPTFAQLIEYESLKLSGSHRVGRISDEAFAERVVLLKAFDRSRTWWVQARAAHMPKTLVNQAAVSFRKFMHRAATPGLTAAMLAAAQIVRPAASAAALQLPQLCDATGAAAAEVPDTAHAQTAGQSAAAFEALVAEGFKYTSAVEAMLVPYFLEFCQHQYRQELKSYAASVATLDLRSPHTWFPYARAIKRKIIYHGGPTNSGKTYNALQSLAAAERGVYCAPLRLLAMEVYETLNHMGVYCDLVTGQEILKVPGSSHMACTVEMANLNMHADVAVIDEIQLIGDDQRGFAWSRALLGLPANTIHVCGDTSAVGLIQHLAEICGDDFELHSYERMTPLQLDTGGLPGGWSDVKPGDAVVAFSRKNIYKARKAIEASTGQRTCIVYGALPAETRRHQARLFNDPSSGVNILVASDAIGLGLNFNIRRVIFTTLNKTGRYGRPSAVPVSLVKQIAGRAGRRNSIYPEGLVTTLYPKDLRTMQKALEVPMSKLYTPAAGLAPEYETVELLSAQMPHLTLEQLFKKLDTEARLDGRYFLCNQEHLLETARVLGKVKGLSLQDQFTLVNAPIDAFDPRQRTAFLEFAMAYASGQPVLFNEALMPPAPPEDEWQMQEAESLHKIISVWLWLSYRFEEGSFPGRERVQALTRQLCQWLNIGLSNIQTAAVNEAAAAVADLQGQQAQLGDQASSSSNSNRGNAVDSSSSSASSSRVVECDSNDADEINEAVFVTPVVEVSAGRAQGSAAAGEALLGTLVQPSSCGSSGMGRQDASADKPIKKKRLATQEPVLYVNWGNSTVNSGLVCSSTSSAAAAECSSTHSSSDNIALLTQQIHPAAVSASSTANSGSSVEDLEKLLMPEFETDMGRFITWRSRPKFKPPPPPQLPEQNNRANIRVAEQRTRQR